MLKEMFEAVEGPIKGLLEIGGILSTTERPVKLMNNPPAGICPVISNTRP